MAKSMIYISAVIPVYSGESYLRQLVSELDTIKEDWETNNLPIRLCEAIFVDDGSVDNSKAVLKDLAHTRSWMNVLEFSKNFGQHPATIAGVLHTSGDWVVTMDEDLQHPPSKILDLLKTAVNDSLDLVYANSPKGVHGSFFRDFSSSMFKRIISWSTGNPYIRNANSFRLIRGEIARAAAAACNFETYLDVALYWFTNAIGTKDIVLTDVRFQENANSGYSFRSLISHARRMIISSQMKLLRIGGMVGIGFVTLAFGFGIYLLVQKIFSPETVPVRGWTSLMFSLYFVCGIIVLLISILLELITTLVQGALGKPSYFVVDRSKDDVLRAFLAEKDRAGADA